MNWTDDYINLKFKPDGRDRNGVDCYGLLYLVYKEQLNIELEKYEGIFIDESISCLKKVAKVMKEEREKWVLVNSPKLYDMIMLRTGLYTWHVGLVLDKRYMLHIMRGIESCIEDYTSILWKNRVDEIRRHSERT